MKKSVIVLLHLGYWLTYMLVIAIILMALRKGQPITMKSLGLTMFFSPFGLFSYISGLIGFYTFYLVLFDRFLIKKRIMLFILAALITSILGAVITELSIYIAMEGKYVNWNMATCFSMGLFLAFLCCLHGVVALVIKGFITWYGDIKIKMELSKKNYEMELALMKAQINPHFLFNTINNIDMLIQKDPLMASEYLNKLSDIMRFMLYETKTDKIELAKELSYIEKYIALQKIRTSNPNYIKYEVKGSTGNVFIEPMLFIPFIENAFKHAENKKLENAITISFMIEPNQVRFECENTYSENMQKKPEHSGLGNELIKRRLELLYMGKYSFDIINSNSIYKVTLLLNL